MADGHVTVGAFKKLERKVNKLLVIQDLDSLLTAKEKKLVNRAKSDLPAKKGNFISIEEL